jgi:Domain of unknown function DUF11
VTQARLTASSELRLTLSVANAGPQTAPHLFFATDLSSGLQLATALPSTGRLHGGRGSRPSWPATPVGSIPPRTATVTFTARVTALPDEMIALGPGDLVPRVTAVARDPRPTDDQAPFMVADRVDAVAHHCEIVRRP